MSLVDRIREANRHDLDAFMPFLVAGEPLGAISPTFAAELARWPEVFRVDDARVALSAELDAPSTPCEVRTVAVAEVCAALARCGLIHGWRNELYPVTRSLSAPPAMLLERSAVPSFGVTAYGVHMNGYTLEPDGSLRMWVARRALSKPTGPGKLDQMVAGGQPHGIGLTENMIKECAEEAGIPRRLARRVRPVGAISYVLQTERGLRPDVLFNFDLELPTEFVPVNDDGEVDCFYLWDMKTVHEVVSETDEFKFNCSLVVIDFMIRHGLVDADDRDYEQLVQGLHPPLPTHASR